MTITFEAKLARYAVDLANTPLLDQVMHEAKTRVIDTIGCALGALDAPPVVSIRLLSSEMNGPGLKSSVWGSPMHIHPEMAAFVNGVACRYLDFNDIYLGVEACHPSDNLPAAWAVAESERRSGHELLTAVTVGYQIHCLLADTASLKEHGFDNVLYGAIAASVMAGILLHLTADEITEAIRITATSSVALLQTRVGELSMWKGMAAAHAAKNGVFGAYLARYGITGPGEIFEGKKGLISVVTHQFEPPALTTSSHSFKLLETRLKPFAAQYFLQTVIECAGRLRSRVELADISAVKVETFDYAYEVAANDPEKWHPSTRETADHSLPYCIAMALLHGTVGPESFESDDWNNPVVQDVMAKVTVAIHPDLSSQYPAYTPATVTITTRQGATIIESASIPLGHPHRPLSNAAIEEKFKKLVCRCLSEDEAIVLFDGLHHLDDLNVLPSMPHMIHRGSLQKSRLEVL